MKTFFFFLCLSLSLPLSAPLLFSTVPHTP